MAAAFEGPGKLLSGEDAALPGRVAFVDLRRPPSLVAALLLVLAQEPVFVWVEPGSFLLDFFGAGAFDFALLNFFSVPPSASSWGTAGAALESFLLPLVGLAGGCCCESDSVTEALLELLDLSRDLLCRLEAFVGAEAFEVPGSSGLSVSGDR